MPHSAPDPLRSLVTGANGSLGSAIVETLLKRGDQVIGLDINPRTDGPCPHIRMDVTNRASVDAAMATAHAQLGGLDVLVHAAGAMQICPFADLTEAALTDLISVNLLGTFSTCQAFAKIIKKSGGRIVILTSIHGQIGVPGRAAYAASKGAIAAMGRVMAAELAGRNIRVNMLSPGAVSGGMTPDPRSRAGWASATPSGRVAEISEVARAAAMLTSDDASFVNGQTIAIDGGASTIRSL